MTLERQRRYHQRSRAGCLACKIRHVRCDERWPCWLVERGVVTTARTQPELTYGVDSSKCLVIGSECQYPVLPAVPARMAIYPRPAERRNPGVPTVCDEKNFSCKLILMT